MQAPMQAPQGDPNQNLAMFAQMANAPAPQGPGAPQMQQGAPPPQPPQAPQAGMPQQPQPNAPGQQMAISPRLPPPGASGHSAFTPQELAALGRNGDSVVAHMTPGEIAVPPQVQTPKVLATLREAFAHAGAQPSQFIAGSPNASVNPQTGMPEYSFFSHLLPIALGLAGNAILPGLGTGLSAATAGAIGTGAGTALGGLITGQNPLQALLTGAGAGVGGYAMGNLFNGADAAAGAAGAPAAAAGAEANPMQQQFLQGFGGDPGLTSSLDLGHTTFASDLGAGGAGAAANGAAQQATEPGLMNLYGALNKNMSLNIPQMLGSTIGGQIGSAMGAPVSSLSPEDARAHLSGGFNEPYTHTTQSWQQLLGQNDYKGPNANFNGYDPSASNSVGWEFYPPHQTQGVM